MTEHACGPGHNMKSQRLIRAATLLLMLGRVVPAFAMQEKPKEGGKGPKKTESAKPPRQAPRARGQEPRQQPVRSQDQRAGRAGPGPFRVRRDEQRDVWPQYRAQNWQSEHRDWRQRGGYQGYRIPAYRFRGYFGRDHGFRLVRLPLVIVSGTPRFQRGEVWFSLLDPWPEYWPNDWYETDDVYIEYGDDGYYLYNRGRPDVRLAVTVYER